MNAEIIESTKDGISKLPRIKSILQFSAGVFILRYILLIISIIWSETFSVQNIPVLFICQIGLALFAYVLFCYGLMGIKDHLPHKQNKRIMNGVVISILAMIVLLVVVLFAWIITNFIPFSESFPYELRIELIVIAMPFVELIPLTVAMFFLSVNFWALRTIEGWKTKMLISPFFIFPLTVVRILAAIFKIINILEPTKYSYAWTMADYSRIITAILGIFLFIEIFINIMRIKPKIIIQQNQ